MADGSTLQRLRRADLQQERAETYERVLGMDEERARYLAARDANGRIEHLRDLILCVAHIDSACMLHQVAFGETNPVAAAQKWQASVDAFEDLAIVANELRQELMLGTTGLTWECYFEMVGLLAGRVERVKILVAMLRVRSAERPC